MTAIQPVPTPYASPRSRHIGELARWSVLAVSFVVALRPLGDNSFLTHLTTGRIMLEGPTIVRADVLTAPSAGTPWVAQSWLASVIYGVTDALGGLVALRLLVGVLAAGLTWLLWALCRSAPTLLARLATVAFVVVGGMHQWGERPLMFGLVAFAAVLLVLREEYDPRWLVPIFWGWAQVHGSFPLGFVIVAIVAVTGGLGTARPVLFKPTSHARRALGWSALGVALGGIVNPYGPDLLLFPFRLIGNGEALRDVHEWQHPDLVTGQSLIVLAAAAFVVVQAGMRRNSRDLALVVSMVGLWWSAQRNLAPLVIVLAPLVASYLPPIGALSGAESVSRPRRFVRLLLAATAVLSVVHLLVPSFDDRVYPAELVTMLESDGRLGGSLVHREYVGNYLEYRYEGDVEVFFDDRYELHSTALIQDHRTLVRGTDGWEDVLARWEPDLIIWNLHEPLAPLLDGHPAWVRTHEADGWAAFAPA